MLRVSLADKLHNARALLADYRREGEAVWGMFNAGRDDQIWYYRGVLEVFWAGIDSPMVGELERVVTELERLAEAQGS